MLNSIFETLFGCSHRTTTFPLTPRKIAGRSATSNGNRHGAYVVCLACGKEFSYDWNAMRIGKLVDDRTTDLEVRAGAAAVRNLAG